MPEAVSRGSTPIYNSKALTLPYAARYFEFSHTGLPGAFHLYIRQESLQPATFPLFSLYKSYSPDQRLIFIAIL